MKTDLGLLVLRLGAGGMMAVGHGWGKLLRVLDGRFGFADPLGVGAGVTLLFAVFAEFFCALAVAVGFKARWAAIPVLVTMLVAAFVHHAADPFGKKELPLLYAAVFLAVALGGAGRYALDRKLKR
ncbi:MAG: DoxX family protein [Thermoanaerobaculia bacterium]|nr:DoxX family protein [Thermoanaerobaculia bacterium]